ncbi:MAG: GAF domain-containing sensor histidine kinase [Anaerolineae bacterium]|nr:GAF domain-containing sensor histidine kinase [Anaerolineae bacterium]
MTDRDRSGDASTWDQVQQRLYRYERILEISQELAVTFDHQALLRLIVNAASELTNSQASSILLLDTVSGELRFEMASNMTSRDFENIVVPIDGSIAGWVVTHGEARVVRDIAADPGFSQQVEDATQVRTQNLLAVPLKSRRGQVIGVLEALNKRERATYEDDDIKMLTLLALHAATAIENARLFQQSDFMAEMVHELRTPLVALKTSTALLSRPDLPAERHADIIETLQSETERLVRLTSEYLDLARLESGRAQLEISEVPLSKLLYECVDIVRPQASERGIQIQDAISDFAVRADRGKVKQVLLNLLSNAVKYNRDHGVIDIRVTPREDNATAFAQIAVADTGYGIPYESQRHLFEKFYRVADTAGFTQGTGLGLTIARHIIEAHGGNIWLESEPGSGSTFFFTLPAVNRLLA